MASTPEFFRCEICGNLTYRVDIGAGTMVCCGKDMVALAPNTVDAAKEKHVPVVSGDNPFTIKIGELPHPMEADHHIEWVFAQGADTGSLYKLAVGSEPQVVSGTLTEKPVTVYAYCNLHGLWSTSL